jgi:hypothetical protein
VESYGLAFRLADFADPEDYIEVLNGDDSLTLFAGRVVPAHDKKGIISIRVVGYIRDTDNRPRRCKCCTVLRSRWYQSGIKRPYPSVVSSSLRLCVPRGADFGQMVM